MMEPVNYGRVLIVGFLSAFASAIVGGTLSFQAATTSTRIDAATFRASIEKDLAALQDWRASTERDRYRSTDARADVRALCSYIDAVLLRVETITLENRVRVIELEKKAYGFNLNGIVTPPVHRPPVCN